MKNTLLIFSIGFLLLSCGNNSSEIEELKRQNEQLSKKLDELIDEEKSKNKVREEICQRWANGAKKIVCFKKGYLSNEEIIKRIYYSDDQIKIGIESYKNGKVDGMFYSWDRWGDKQYEIEFKEGKFNGIFKYYRFGELECHSEFENDKWVKTIKGDCSRREPSYWFLVRSELF